MSAALPDIMTSILRASSGTLPVTFSVSLNQHGAVTLTAGPHTPSSAYAPFFEALIGKLNQSFPVGNHPFLEFRTAHLFTDVIIHNLPLSILPPDHPALLERLQESIHNTTDATILSARFLQKDLALRETKRTTLVVVSLPPQDLYLLGPDLLQSGTKIRLFNRLRDACIAQPASRDTQCKKCYHFGHSLPLCKDDHHTCPICAKPHSQWEHKCANASCPKEGNVKVVADCCTATGSRCINCDDNHPATSPVCPVRVAIRDAIRPPREQDLPDAPPSAQPSPHPRTLSQQALSSRSAAPPPTIVRNLTDSCPATSGQFTGFFNPSAPRPQLFNTLATRVPFPSTGPAANWSEDPLEDFPETL